MKVPSKYKRFLLMVKYGPTIIALICFAAGIMQFLLSNWLGVYICAILILLFLGAGMLHISHTFDFCIYHKITIAYIILWTMIQCSYWYWSWMWLAIINWVLNYSFIFILTIIIIYLKFKK